MLLEELESLRFAVEGVDGLVGGGGIKKVGARVAGEEEATVDDGESEDGKEAEEDPERLHYITVSASEESVGGRGAGGKKITTRDSIENSCSLASIYHFIYCTHRIYCIYSLHTLPIT